MGQNLSTHSSHSPPPPCTMHVGTSCSITFAQTRNNGRYSLSETESDWSVRNHELDYRAMIKRMFHNKVGTCECVCVCACVHVCMCMCGILANHTGFPGIIPKTRASTGTPGIFFEELREMAQNHDCSKPTFLWSLKCEF